MFSFWNLFPKGIILIFIFLILNETNSSSVDEQKAILSTLQNEKQIVKIADNSFGYKMTEQGRKKRFVFTLSVILILAFWNSLLGPFIQIQITQKFNLIGTFRETVSEKL